MESDDDFLLSSPTEEPPSPVYERKLKRLKKSIRVSDNPLVSPADESPPMPAVNFSNLEAHHFEESNSQDIGESDEPLRRRIGSEGMDGENELNSGFDSLDVEEDGPGPKIGLEFDSVAEEFDQKGQGQTREMGEKSGDSRMEEPEKKGRSLDGFEENREKKKRVKSVADDEKPKSHPTSKRKAEKERRANLKQLHAESQRLLRETRDAAFKPVPLVQKPISSILEKIRQRKLEVSKKSVIINNFAFVDDDDDDDDDYYGTSTEDTAVNNSENASSERRGDDRVAKAASQGTIVQPTDMESSLDALHVDGSNDTANNPSIEDNPSQMALDEDLKQPFRAPIDDTQDLFSDSQTCDSKDESPNERPSSPLEVLAPSLLAMNLKLDSAPPDDVSSDEEDNDKENVDPYLHKLSNLSSSPKGDPVKAFVDEEAVEEDDSDNDLSRFQENEDDDNNEDAEELNEMIATGYQEKPIDSERRNQLHQMWLEQQDAAGTENLLQRLKCGSKQKETTLLEEEEDDEGEEDEESGGEAAEDLVQTNVRMNLRKVKQMIPQMFTDKDDAFLSSDDEETEKRLARQCLLEKTEEQSKFLSPEEDESSREFFGLIKKLNIVPDTKKKAKTSSFFNTILTRGNRNSSSKSSFLGQRSNNSLPSYQKHGSSKVRSFIFGRDDSNSKSTISVSEDSSDTIQRESPPTRAASVKFSNPRFKSSTQNTKTAVKMNSGNSLYEILRRSTLKSDHCTQDNVVGLPESVFAAFKLEKKPIKTT